MVLKLIFKREQESISKIPQRENEKFIKNLEIEKLLKRVSESNMIGKR